MKRLIGCVLAAAMAASITGCNEKKDFNSEAAGQHELTYWMEMNDDATRMVDNLAQTQFVRELEKQTGVKLKFIHPPRNKGGENFQMLLASRELPDLMASEWYSVAGGPQKAIQDGYILDLNNIFDQYAPNLSGYLQQNPEIDKMIKTREGNYYVFPFIRGDESLTIQFGPVVRRDWLEQLGLGTPETIDDWTDMLRQFRQLGATAPLTVQGESYLKTLIGAYGISSGIYKENEKVYYGPVMPQYKEFLSLVKAWYEEGLLDPYFTSSTMGKMEYNMVHEISGACAAFIGSSFGRMLKAMDKQGKELSLQPVPYPVLRRGERQKFTHREHRYTPIRGVAITTSCKDVQAAAKFLDFGYSEQGQMLYNFGIEGESYTMKNGYPRYTDKILGSDDVAGQLACYTQTYSGPFIQDVRYIEQYYAYPQQKEAVKLWMDSEMKQHMMPMLYMPVEDQRRVSQIKSDIERYVEKMFIDFVMGVQPLESFDQYVEHVYSLGLEEFIACQQKALDDYNRQ